MSKKFMCLWARPEGDHYFTPGKVYVLNDDNSVRGDRGGPFGPHEFSTIEWLEKQGWYKFKEVSDMEFIVDGKINLSALKTGDWIECERTSGNESSLQVMKDTPVGVVFREYPRGQSSVCCRVDRDIDYAVNISEYRVIKVFRSDNITDFCSMHIRPGNCVFEWHNEPERKKMTVDEIEAALGYKVAIVDADGKEEK